jgi:acetamidase/formamidase
MRIHSLKASLKTVQWGAFNAATPPVLHVSSGDIVDIECLSHHAGDAPDLMMDDAIREIYSGIPEGDRTPGVHILTGPIFVEGAEPGDTLECRVLSLEPRIKYGVNFQGRWGCLNEEFNQEQHVTVYEADVRTATARAVFQYAYDTPEKRVPGRITGVPASKRKPALENIVVPLRLHFGTAGVAPKEDGPVSTVPPGPHGGNVDNREFLAGTSMFYPILRPGALFWAGDTHLAQGDGEVNGTAIEAHVNAKIQLVLHKGARSRNPILETPTYWVCHGLNRDLDEAVREAVLEMIDLLGREWGLSRSEAYSLCSVAGDVRVTQVVDGVKGAHIAIRRDLKRT